MCGGGGEIVDAEETPPKTQRQPFDIKIYDEKSMMTSMICVRWWKAIQYAGQSLSGCCLRGRDGCSSVGNGSRTMLLIIQNAQLCIARSKAAGNSCAWRFSVKGIVKGGSVEATDG